MAPTPTTKSNDNPDERSALPPNVIVSSLPENSNGNIRIKSNAEINLDTDAKNNKAASKFAKSRVHWILHFDINETILVGDEVGGDTIQDCYNKIIAKSAFCRIPKASATDDNNDGDEDGSYAYDYDNTSILKPTHWWDGTPIIKTKPTDNDDNTQQQQQQQQHIPPLYTGWTWPPGCCPYYRTSYKQISKTFVEHHGSIYQPIQEEMVRRLMAAERPEAPEFHNILPALFRTLYTLVHQEQEKQQQQPPLTIVFRTFGTDLPNIAAAMTAFAKGKHPDYPDFIHPEYELDESRLYNAKWVPIVEEDENKEEGSSNKKEYFQYQLYRHSDNTLAAAGDEQVLEILHNTSKGGQYNVYGIRDDYPMWKHHNWEPWAGKPVWITEPLVQSNATRSHPQQHHHHVLFDDNIHNLPHDGIASVRRQVPSCSNHGQHIFESLSGSEIQSMHGLHLVRVPTIEPILNAHWFLEQFQNVQVKAIEAHYKST